MWEDVPRWVSIAKAGERAGFATTSLTYVLPFIYVVQGEGVSAFTSPYRYGVELFFVSLNALIVAPWPLGLRFFGMFCLPLLSAIAGLLLQKGRGRVPALARFLCAVVGLSGVTLAFLWQPVNWQFGFYGAAAGLTVAVVAAGLRSLAAFRYPADETI